MRIVILGAGFGGLELSTRLSEEFGDGVDVVLIDKGEGFVFGFSKLDVMFGFTDAEHVLHRFEMFLMRQNPDGSILLEPAVVLSKNQLEYDQDPELRELLAKAAASSTVRRSRRKRQR